MDEKRGKKDKLMIEDKKMKEKSKEESMIKKGMLKEVLGEKKVD